MKALTLALSTLVLSAAAQADGFRCEAIDADLNVSVYHKTNPADGTRVASIMVVSDPTVSAGRKTIATFKKSNANLVSSGTSYYAVVDENDIETSRGGELLAGTKLGFVRSLRLDVDFSYSAPVKAGKDIPAVLTLKKHNGERIEVAMSCTRYLKGE